MSTEQTIAVFRGPHQPDTDISAKVDALQTLLRDATSEFKSLRLASSLAAEDNVLFDVVARLQLNVDCFSLETGRLNPETLAVIPALQVKYGKTVRVVTPVQAAVDEYVSANGMDAFYDSTDLRKACCNVRKVEPLNRALQGADAWITGQRKAQAATRKELPVREMDDARGIVKFNPLAEWSEADIWTYIRRYDVPVNALHFEGYPSIGCQPCTRAVTFGEDIRAGRWWWEDPTSKECGLHAGNISRLKSA